MAGRTDLGDGGEAPDPVTGEPELGDLPAGLSEARRQRDAELARKGWERRFVASPPRLKECEEIYRSMGLEVLLDPIGDEELREECGGCTLALTLFRVLYTRRPLEARARQGPPPASQGEEP